MAEVINSTRDYSGQGHNPASPTSSPEPLDDDADDKSSHPTQWSKSASPGAGGQSQPPKASAPLQKRRRVTRACDECRRKKIKCDGRQACSHCEIYGYECTYDQPSNRRRNPAPQYIENLEIRLQRAEGLIRTYLPNIDLNDPSIDNAILQPRHGGTPHNTSLQGLAAKPPPAPAEADPDGQLRSMIESTGQLDLDEDGQWDFHGGSSGTVFMDRMRQQFGGLLGVDQSNPFLPKLPRPYPGRATAFDSPRSSSESPLDASLSHVVELPPKAMAEALIRDSLDTACALMRFVHEPSFMEMFNRIYDTAPEDYSNEQTRFLPLLYLVLALGCMFHFDPNDDPMVPVHNTYRAGIDQGLKYFRAARSLMDITDCRDLISLQAILFMVMFLQSTANLSTCYSYIGIALRSALRMGLHRNLAFNFNPIERETRRRVFWVIRKMDTYVSALLGFPNMLSNEDIDQEYPLELDDEYITKDAILPMPKDRFSLYAATNAHSRLMIVLSKVVKNIYPMKKFDQTVQEVSACYVVSHAKIKEIEGDLIQWFEQLPMALRPDSDSKPEVVRVQQFLRLGYAHVQMMLYRPFLHYVSQKSNQGKLTDKRSYACAAACVSVSRNIIHITTELRKRGLLDGAYWFTMYTTFFAIISLVYYVLENPNDPASEQILADANAGNDALKSFAQRSQAADRCSAALRGLFEKLPEKLKNDQSVAPKKKRAAPSLSSSAPSQPVPGPARRQANFNKEPKMGISRATTFPLQAQSDFVPSNQSSRSSLDGPRFHAPTASNPNLRQSFNEYVSPEASSVATPDSGSLTSQGVMPQFSQSMGVSSTLPDLSAMMFPSEDPFAYPNQPMMEFDNFKRENMDMMSGSPIPQMYMQHNNHGNHGNQGNQVIYDDLEGQIFGPLPPYVSQGQPGYDMRQQMSGMANAMNPINGQQMGFQQGMPPNFDGIFNGGEVEDWGNMLPNQRFRP